MKIKHSSVAFSLLAGGVLASSIAPAQAATFTMTAQDVVDARCLGQAVCNDVGTDDFFQVSAGSWLDDNKQISAKDEHGVLGLGVSTNAGSDVFNRYDKADKNHAVKTGDNVSSWGEIDKDEFLKVDFDGPAILKSLDLSTLYHGTRGEVGAHGDKVSETVKVTANLFSGGLLEGILSVTGDTTATWTVGGETMDVVTNLSSAMSGGGGSFSVANLFGDELVTGISLTPDSKFKRYTIQDSDFTLSKIVVEQPTDRQNRSSVPEPGTLSAILGVAAAAGLKLRRRVSGDAA